MANQWSDYRNVVYNYLRHYNRFVGKIANIDIEIESTKAELHSLYDIRPVKYGEHLPGGFDELSPMERTVFRKELLEAKLPRLQANRDKLTNLIRRIDSAMMILSENENRVVRLKFIEGKRWLAIADAMQYSERRCQEILRNAVDNITDYMFPDAVEGQQQFSFVFLPSRSE